ncbi:MAG: hypothetical protein JXK94_04090 [Deltaproteobacteria bacterium]|nr:hypothetical protein [Deltaproteobacteria bacterium]
MKTGKAKTKKMKTAKNDFLMKNFSNRFIQKVRDSHKKKDLLLKRWNSGSVCPWSHFLKENKAKG